ncbi:AzlD domain-containing protein [Hansschlegelia zhihuaiae]|uniref:AzlD domain-containing protein n=1 Tax=Hansschlegelia zhihuaiae TaxID=405005 RepID=A0A4V1KJR5_9HYPH|nr:AzlD domain-containing protein [Hansschlegelia zhihuaiae]RXF75112.1 AzlD domain-containing protein [Hansschlegelia zhihuaiae]
MTHYDGWFMLAAILAAFAANEVWRVVGVALSARLHEDSAVFSWVKMVATALVAGLVAKLVLNPTGGLALAPLWLRLGSVAFGVAAYALGRRSLALGVAAAAATLMVGTAVIAPGAPP